MTNFYIVGGLLIAAAFGGVLPTDPELWVKDDNWRIIYGIPAVISMIQIAAFLVHFTEEPIAFSIGKGDDAAAERLISKLFTVPGAKTSEEKIAAYKAYISLVRLTTNTGENSTVSFKDAVCHPKYRKATWTCFVLGIFN
jgi:hypothetical protein